MIDVIKGPAAIGQVGYQLRYWIGVASGNRYCKYLRRTPEKAIADATRLERKILKNKKRESSSGSLFLYKI